VDKFALFTDVSVNPQRQVGVGACLLVPLQLLATPPHEIDREGLGAHLQCRRFIETSSTILELQTVLWGLAQVRKDFPDTARRDLHLYTDSQFVVGLSGRRAGLERRSYLATRSGCLLSHAPLYSEFYAASDELDFAVVKVTGHVRAATRDSVQRIFSIVDQGSRRELKLWMKEASVCR
jgi:ribonuclease HI